MKKYTLPLVSIITPSYNQGNYLEETINSVLSQSYKKIQYIVVDGLSTDSSSLIIKKYQAHISNIVIEKDSGQSDAINKGFKLANGDYIGWINSDDLLDKYAIERSIDILRKNNEIDFIYGNVKLIDKNSNQIGTLKGASVRFPDLLLDVSVPIPQQGSLWKKSIYETLGGLDPSYHYALDRDYFLKICSNFNSLYINEELGCFRMHEYSKSVANTKGWIMEIPIMYKKLLESTKISELDETFKTRVLSSAFLYTAYLSIKNYQIFNFMRCLTISIRMSPFTMFNSINLRKIKNKILK